MIDPYLEEDHECSGDSSCEDCFLAWKKRAETAQAEIVALRASLKTAQEKAADRDEAYGYLSRLFTFCAPQCHPLSTVAGVATQIDNYIAGLRAQVKTAEQEREKDMKGTYTHECGLAVPHTPDQCWDKQAMQLSEARRTIATLQRDLTFWRDTRHENIFAAVNQRLEAAKSKLSTLLAARDRLIEQMREVMPRIEASNGPDVVSKHFVAKWIEALSTLGEQA